MPCAADPTPAPTLACAGRLIALALALLMACVLPLGVAGTAEPAGADEPVTVVASDDAARLERPSPVQRHRLATAVRRARAVPFVAAWLRSPGLRSDEAPRHQAGPTARPVTRRGPPVS
jgi:hypothetical protein